jgi:hypothetical protein
VSSKILSSFHLLSFGKTLIIIAIAVATVNPESALNGLHTAYLDKISAFIPHSTLVEVSFLPFGYARNSLPVSFFQWLFIFFTALHAQTR